jgi:tetratricopeptide (TPR) repeat protein
MARPAGRRKLVSAIGLAATLVVALGIAIYALIGPTRMDPRATMNIAVTEVGAMDERGGMQRSADGDLIRGWVVGALDAANAKTAASSQMAIWHDDLPRTQKRVKLGRLAGKSPEDRAQAAEALAQRIGADVVIYGHLEPAGNGTQLVQEFYVTPRLRPEANETIGRYELGEPIPVPADLLNGDSLAKGAVAAQVGDRTTALYRLLLALREDTLGRHEQALALLRQTEADLASWSGGSEILYYFIAREALYLKRYDEAEAAARKAVTINPDYVRGYVVLGGISQDRAQTLSAAERLAPGSPLEQALASDQQAVDRTIASGDTYMELIARLAVASAHIAMGTAHYQLDTPAGDADALRWFDQVLVETRPLLAPLAEVKQYRLLALAYSYIGVAYLQQASLAQRQADVPGSTALFSQARDAFQGCIDQGSRLQEDHTLTAKIIGGICRPYQQIAVDALRSLEGGK